MADQVRDPARPGADREAELLEGIEAAMAPPRATRASRSSTRCAGWQRSRSCSSTSRSSPGRSAAPGTAGSSRISTSGCPCSSCSRASCSTGRSSPPASAARRPAFRGYARRRLLRIAPAYWAVPDGRGDLPRAWRGLQRQLVGLLRAAAELPGLHARRTCARDGFRCGIPPPGASAIEVFFYAVLPFFALPWPGSAVARRPLARPELAVLAAISVALGADPEPPDDLSSWWSSSRRSAGAGGSRSAWGSPAFSVWVQQRGASRGRSLGGGPPRRAAWRRRGAVRGPRPVVLDPGPTAGFPVGAIGQYIAQYVLFG